MEIVLTGAGGFLGSRVADLLLSSRSPLSVGRLVLSDVAAPATRSDPRAESLAADLTDPAQVARLVTPRTAAVLHLAAAVSGRCEEHFDEGLAANLDATRALLEAVRHTAPGARFVFASTVGVFGGELPPVIDERVALTPQSTYGTAKAMCELLVSDYSRRGFVDGRSVRLPTVTVRAGAANAAVTSFASGIVREPLAGLPATCPVGEDVELWVCGPASAAYNLVHAAARGPWAGGALCLPGLRVSVRDMLRALERAGGPDAVRLVTVRPDPAIERLVRSFPTLIDASRALSLGFIVNSSFDEIVQDYINNDLPKN